VNRGEAKLKSMVVAAALSSDQQGGALAPANQMTYDTVEFHNTALAIIARAGAAAYLVGDLSPLCQPYNDTLQRVGDALVVGGTAPPAIAQTATGFVYQSVLQQSGILAYIDLFAIGAIVSFAMAPLVLLFSPVKADGGVAPAH
jgi:hypothetical protein